MATAMFNVRVDVELFDAIEDAAAREGVTKSVWAREVMGAVAIGGVTLRDLGGIMDGRKVVNVSPHPARQIVLGGVTGRTEKVAEGCAHPLSAVKQLPFTDVCGLCGYVLRRR